MVENALKWLKDNNPVYRNIIISDEQLPLDGQCPDIHTVEYKEGTINQNDAGQNQ